MFLSSFFNFWILIHIFMPENGGKFQNVLAVGGILII